MLNMQSIATPTSRSKRLSSTSSKDCTKSIRSTEMKSFERGTSRWLLLFASLNLWIPFTCVEFTKAAAAKSYLLIFL